MLRLVRRGFSVPRTMVTRSYVVNYVNASMRRVLEPAAVRYLSSSKTLVPHYEVKFKKGDQVSGLVVPNLITETVDTLAKATILIANPAANHYLVATDDFKRVNCVQLNRPALLIGRDIESTPKLSSFISQFTHVEYGFVETWPNLEYLNSHSMASYSIIVEKGSHKPKPRSVVRLSSPNMSMAFFIYSSRTASKLIQKFMASKSCCPLHMFPFVKDLPKSPSVVYFPHGHLVDPSVNFNSIGQFSKADTKEFLDAFLKAHTDNPHNDITEEDVYSLYQETLMCAYPEGFLVAFVEPPSDEEDGGFGNVALVDEKSP